MVRRSTMTCLRSPRKCLALYHYAMGTIGFSHPQLSLRGHEPSLPPYDSERPWALRTDGRISLDTDCSSAKDWKLPEAGTLCDPGDLRDNSEGMVGCGGGDTAPQGARAICTPSVFIGSLPAGVLPMYLPHAVGKDMA